MIHLIGTALITVLVVWPAHVLQYLLTHRLVAVAAAGPAYVALVLVHPVHKCPRCRGAKVIRKGSRHKRCHWCKGHGRTRRLGANLAHRVFWDHVGPWIRVRYQDAVERYRDGAS